MSLPSDEDLASFFDMGTEDVDAIGDHSNGEVNNGAGFDSVPDLVGTNMSNPNDDLSSISCSLRERLHAAVTKGKSLTGETTNFLPLSELKRLITPENVRKELFESGVPVGDGFSKAIASDLPRIFATLAVLSNSVFIQDFMAHGLDDRCLPVPRAVRDDEPAAASHGQLQSLRRLFRGLNEQTTESFLEWQYIMSPPQINLSFHSPHLGGFWKSFDQRTVLPFINVDHGSSGSFGTVSRVRIHPSHFIGAGTLENPESSSQYYAIKKLLRPDEQDFRRELTALHVASQLGHSNIVRLVTSFRQGPDYHFLFPWADGGDLSTFWRLNPDPEKSTTNYKWFMDQCSGIAHGLSMIHGFSPREPAMATPEFGRHGDIKPANILYFHSEKRNQDTYGTLKLCDFGSSSIGTSPLNMEPSDKVPRATPVYRAPEFDIEPGKISRLVDIWSLGCVFLEFVTWMVSGQDGLDQLAARRLDTTPGCPSRDAFFEHTKDHAKAVMGPIGAKLKIGVLEVSPSAGHPLVIKADPCSSVGFHHRGCFRVLVRLGKPRLQGHAGLHEGRPHVRKDELNRST